MNIEALTIIIRQDMSDLTDISNVLEKDYTLSKMEVQFIQSRIQNISKNINQLIDYVNLNTTQSTVIELQNAKEKESTIPVKLPENNKSYEYKHTIIETPIDINKKESLPQEKKIFEPIVQKQLEKENKETTIIHSPILDNKINENSEKTTVENKTPKTIAERLSESGTSSVNDRIAIVKTQTDRASQIGQKPITDLHKAIKLNDRIGYIRELFGKNADTYKQTIDTINQLSSFEEALQYINNNFEWEQENEHFKTFIDLVFRRFLN